MTTSPRRIIYLSIFVILTAGCGNARESLNIGAWGNAGQNAAPPSDWDYKDTLISEGQGKVVASGDLVQLRVRDLGRDDQALNDRHTFWLFTGSDGGTEYLYRSTGYQDVSYLGSPRIRRAVVGHRVGEIFALHAPLEKQDRKLVEILPFKGIIGYQITPIPEVAEKMPIDRRNNDYRLNFWVLGAWSKKNGFHIEVEIVESCKANLLQRVDRLEQWGKVKVIQNIEGHYYSDSRTGNLKHFAIDGRCLNSGPVRFQAGPYYDDQAERKVDKLWDWSHSYMRTSKQPFVVPLSDDYYNIQARRIVSDRNH